MIRPGRVCVGPSAFGLQSVCSKFQQIGLSDVRFQHDSPWSHGISSRSCRTQFIHVTEKFRTLGLHCVNPRLLTPRLVVVPAHILLGRTHGIHLGLSACGLVDVIAKSWSTRTAGWWHEEWNFVCKSRRNKQSKNLRYLSL